MESMAWSGIAGKSQPSTTLASAPCSRGPILGSVRYATQMLDESHVPRSLSCYSMNDFGFVINITRNYLYAPRSVEAARSRRWTQWYEVPLMWTGQRYLLPTDVANRVKLNLMPFNHRTGGGPNERTGAIDVNSPYVKILSWKDWFSLS